MGSVVSQLNQHSKKRQALRQLRKNMRHVQKFNVKNLTGRIPPRCPMVVMKEMGKELRRLYPDGLLHYRLRLLKFFANYNTATPSNSPLSLLWQAAPTQTRLAYQILGRGEVLFVGNHCVVVKRFGNQDNNTNMLCFPWQRENTVTKTRYVLTFLCVSHSINTTQLFANRRSILLRSSESRNFLVQ